MQVFVGGRPRVGVGGDVVAIEVEQGDKNRILLKFHSDRKAPAGGLKITYTVSTDVAPTNAIDEDDDLTARLKREITIPAGMQDASEEIRAVADGTPEGLERLRVTLVDDVDSDGNGPDTDKYDVYTEVVGLGGDTYRPSVIIKIADNVTLWGKHFVNANGDPDQDDHVVHVNDVKQGPGLGNCYLHAALLSIIDRYPATIQGIVRYSGIEHNYRVVLWKYNRQTQSFYQHTEHVTLPLDRGYSQALLSGDTDVPQGRLEIWPQVLETGYAQAMGGWAQTDYKSNNGRCNPATAFEVLLGRSPMEPKPASEFSLQDIANRLNNSNPLQNDLVTFTTKRQEDFPPGQAQVIAIHTYAIIDADVTAGTVKIREPMYGTQLTIAWDELTPYINLVTVLEMP